MTRDATPYNTRREWVKPEGYGIAADHPVEGYYATRLRFGAVRVGVRIWYGPPHDPWTGEEMDRSWRWQAHVNGRYIEFDRVWPACVKEPIDDKEYAYLSSLQAWGEEHAPHSPHAQPNKPIDMLTAPILL